jgi:hypothetical protein
MDIKEYKLTSEEARKLYVEIAKYEIRLREAARFNLAKLSRYSRVPNAAKASIGLAKMPQMPDLLK